MKILILAAALLIGQGNPDPYPLTVSIIAGESHPHFLSPSTGSGVANMLDETRKIRGFEYAYNCPLLIKPGVGFPARWRGENGQQLEVVFSTIGYNRPTHCVLRITETGTIFSLDQNGKVQSRPMGHE